MTTMQGPLAIYERYRALVDSGKSHINSFSYTYEEIQQPVCGTADVERLGEVFGWLVDNYLSSVRANESERVPVLVRDSRELARISLQPLFPLEEVAFGD